ncbi:OmpA family protein [Fulvivirga ligni]|uniref:OmpA family protein n=1 Tax=Fulvivirga ligni TaxID=2904246 RepID=UPI001F3709E4|nr:OmpA family protein [Fulvivirga ligni]UII23287.1 OmpA family protein [Fulvivirga ligni]
MTSTAHSNSYAKFEPNPEKSYVVIGAFSYHKNALKFVSFAQRKSLHAFYEKNLDRGLYYVYVYSSDDKQKAIDEASRVRDEYGFYDAWVYTGNFGKASGYVAAVDTVSGVVESPSMQEEYEDMQEAPEEIEEEQMEEVSEEPEMVSEVEEKGQNLVQEKAAEDISEMDSEEGYFNLYLNAINTKNYQEVKGKVKVIDPERVKELDEVKTHKLVKLKDPHNGTEKVQLITNIFGFKEVQHTIDLDDPVNDSTEAFVDVMGDSIIVHFDLERFKKGDVLVMYNVYFYKDAAIMKPESIFELNSLLDMLNENKKYKVAIHGHTNGNSTGKIIHLDDKDKNYFSLHEQHKETVGSAKKLSQYRAYTIQQWLIEQGVDPARMEIKGWGGKKMLYDKFDAQAQKNVRVEIEITDE